MDVDASVVRAMDTSGRGVVFAGITVVVALLGLVLLRVSVLSGMGIAASISVLLAVLGSLTLLPALLSYLGPRVTGRGHGHTGRGNGDGSSRPAAVAGAVSRRPLVAVLGGTLALLALCVPALSMRLGVADQGTDPRGTTTRAAYDLIAAGFGPGVNGPLAIAVDLRSAADRSTVGALARAIAAQPGVAAVTPPVVAPSGGAALMQVVPTTGPQDQATSRLIHHLRTVVIPTAELVAHVGGTTATFDDFTTVIAGRLWEFILIVDVVVVSVLVLITAFRSLWLPAIGALLNLVSAGAAFGVVVAVFQWGWGAGLLGVQTGPVEPFIPVLAFAILFGLSMDYQVFLVTRVREEWLATGDASRAVRTGQTETGRVIALAAAIMIFVFASFVLSDARSVKLVGFAMAVAVAIDACVVRQFVVPGVLHLLDHRAWWMPHRLAPLLPRVSVDGPVGVATQQMLH